MASPASSLVLYGNTTWTSPYVLSVFVALREKGLPFEVKGVALDRGAHHEEEFARTSLTSRVPVLVDGPLELSESSAIIEYLEDAYPPPDHAAVLPTDVPTRARARQVMAWLRSDLMPIREERSAEYVFYPHRDLLPFEPLSKAALAAAAKLIAAADRLIPLGSGALFGTWCAADTELAMMLQRLIKTEHEVPEKLRIFAELQWERPAVREYAAQKRPPYAPSL